VRRELAELRNAAETLLYTTDQALEGYQELVDAESLDKARTIANELRSRLQEQANTTAIRESYQRLEAVTFAIAEKLYGPPPSNPPPAPAGSDFDVGPLDPEEGR
jgi:molecular chaperone DnaK